LHRLQLLRLLLLLHLWLLWLLKLLLRLLLHRCHPVRNVSLLLERVAVAQRWRRIHRAASEEARGKPRRE
jgi:hypothetical protein